VLALRRVASRAEVWQAATKNPVSLCKGSSINVDTMCNWFLALVREFREEM
jgi:hypothetical protein